MRRQVLYLLALLISCLASRAGSSTNPQENQHSAWGFNIGWVNAYANGSDGALFGDYVCSGNLYAANVGWISLGSGVPANGIQYANDSSTDFGVNMDPAGNLSGLAYGANVGWILFTNNVSSNSADSPRIDLESGILSGYAYGANIGWISLSNFAAVVKTDYLDPGYDSDLDGIPDAWEWIHAGNLTRYDATSDFDGDGISDYEEYLADTDPNDQNDLLRITRFLTSPDLSSMTLVWNSKPTRHYFIQTRLGFSGRNSWADSGLGEQLSDGMFTSRVLNPTITPERYFRVQAVRRLRQF